MNGIVRIDDAPNPLHGDINSHGVRLFVSAGAPIPADELRAFAAELVRAIAAACEAAGAKDVSHVKAVLAHESGFLHAHVVGAPDAARVDGRDGGTAAGFSLVVNAVIYGLGPSAVRESTETAIDGTLGRFGYARASAAE
jgi:hypothetical protein